ncbi:YjgN family protein [Aestuariispira insulae]|uniref:Uncharacterized membrane protein YjgN (DUF898 family) n=1 Tax=Aestuariispira insulae TaxID=1461337 RepID=A0A3D9HPJ0_9PROT|nr:DUF898 family protein [Aestuariispira insulae]RED51231.1 uncharacterized membrane protein YjgN (DUF898 family) [Aestuariispira insulae]
MSITISPDDRIEVNGTQPAADPAPQGKNFAVFVSRAKLFWMLFRFAFLTIITLGIYRFWAKTKLRRYLWSTVEYDGDRFEYHGTAKELFLGFLIALAVLLPLGILNAFLNAVVFAEGGYEAFAFFYSLVFLFVIMFLIQFAFYRMRRYQLTRTSWRSVHFGLDGSAVKYAIMSILWLLFTIVTLGIAYPWMQAWQTRRIIDHARVGDLSFSCSVTGGAVFKRFILFYIGIFVASIATGILGSSVEKVGATGLEAVLRGIIPMFLTVGYMVVGALLLRISIFRLTVNNMQLGGHAIGATFKSAPIVWSAILSTIIALVIYFVAMAGGFGLLALFAGGVSALVGEFGSDPQAAQQVILMAYMFILPMIFIATLFAGAAGMAIFGVTVMRTIVPGISMEHSEKLDQILQSENTGPKYGEGFADALDVGAF